ncbi:MAG: FAD-binding protein, partial [Clostridia bacterium]|nr:FAD-binding protein [Clostridia bacterium]
MEYDQLSCDVLVIGAGAAGLRAALAAHEAGAHVIIMSKRPPGRSGATPSAVFSYCAAIGTEDSPDLHTWDTWRAGVYQGNRKLIEVFAHHAPDSVAWLQKNGMRWDNEDGKYSLAWLAGHSKPRGLHYDHATGKEMARVLTRAVQQAGITVRPYLWVTDILVQDGRAAGVVAYDWQRGRNVYCRAKAVILACGGAGNIYAINTVPTDLCGDGFSLAYHAGAELVDMEFVQMYPTVVIWPASARGIPLTSGLLFPAGAELLNNREEPFFQRYSAKPLGEATRDEVAAAIAREVMAGRGTAHGGAFLKLGQAPASLAQMAHFKHLQKLGVDLTKDKVEVAPGAHFWLGGVVINTEAATSLAGLYAAGEVAGGLHGANRLAGNALPETIVFGAIAGKQAAQFARETEEPRRQELTGPCWEFITRKQRRAGRKPREIMAELQQIMQECCGVLRERRFLRQAERDLEGLALEASEAMALSNPSAGYNNEVCTAIELFHALQTARLVVKAAVNRQESRGAHQRLDYPEQYPQGAVNQLIRREGQSSVFLFQPNENGPEGVIIHLKSGSGTASYKLQDIIGKTVLEVLQLLPEAAGKVVHYSDHNCKR